MGAPASRKVWRRRRVPAVYVGTYADPAGARACVFADPLSGRTIGPMNLQLGLRTPWTFPAPRVGPPPDSRPGRLGHLEHYGIEWEGRQKGPAGEPRGVFLRFEEGGETRDLGALPLDGFLIGLLGDTRRLDALTETADIELSHWGLLVARRETAAAARLDRVRDDGLIRLTALVLRGEFPGAPDAVRGFVVAPPGLLERKPRERLEGVPEPDAGPFGTPTHDPVRYLRAAGVGPWRAALRALEGARETGDVHALGLDAAGRLTIAEGGTIRRLHGCSPWPAAGLRFGDVLRLQLQDDRIGWAEAVGRNEAGKAVDILLAGKSAALLARAAEEGAVSWDAWEKAADGSRIREGLALNPSMNHARRLERRLPGPGDARERLGAVLAVVAAYWRAGAFDDARILLGRMPVLLPETRDAPVWRASTYLHALLEGRHVHDATEESRDELANVWDGTLSPLAEEFGPAFAGRCAEALDNAGL